jgi:hypothetical protein
MKMLVIRKTGSAWGLHIIMARARRGSISRSRKRRLKR